MKCQGMNKKLYHLIAISLIVISFLLYAIMPLNSCLPFSACMVFCFSGTGNSKHITDKITDGTGERLVYGKNG